MRCEFLPPYSPDYNPIELAFSAIKADFRHRFSGSDFEHDVSTETETKVILAIQESVFSVTSWDAYSWFRKCGYS
jgi:transposase